MRFRSNTKTLHLANIRFKNSKNPSSWTKFLRAQVKNKGEYFLFLSLDLIKFFK